MNYFSYYIQIWTNSKRQCDARKTLCIYKFSGLAACGSSDESNAGMLFCFCLNARILKQFYCA